MNKIIDVSKWNSLDYSAVKKSGVDGAIVKVINQSNKANGLFHTHIGGFAAAGIPVVGGYTYSYANTVAKAKKAAAAFVDIGVPKGIKTMWLDLEDSSIKGLGAKIIDIINAYRNAAEKAKMNFGIYTGPSYYNPCIKPYQKEIADIPIWWARYPLIKEYSLADEPPDKKYLPASIQVCGWQYTSMCKINGNEGYVDLSVWYQKETVQNTAEISAEQNPFAEPKRDISYGTRGNDVRWVQWYCWRFGCLLDSKGQPDSSEIDGIFGGKTLAAVKEAQRRLGMPQTGVVKTADRAVWKKLC